jgi:hypothetical protein
MVSAFLELISLLHLLPLVRVSFSNCLDRGSYFLRPFSLFEFLLEFVLFQDIGVLGIEHISAHFFVCSLLSIILVGGDTVSLNHGCIELFLTRNCLPVQLVFHINTGLKLLTKALLVVSVVLVVSLLLKSLHLYLVEHVFTFAC